MVKKIKETLKHRILSPVGPLTFVAIIAVLLKYFAVCLTAILWSLVWIALHGGFKRVRNKK